MEQKELILAPAFLNPIVDKPAERDYSSYMHSLRHRLRKRPSMALFAMFAYLLVGLSVAEGTVLCIEEDGRVAVEVSHNSMFGTPLQSTVANSHRGSCADIPIYVNSSGGIVVNSQKISQQVDTLGFSEVSPAIYSFDKNVAPIFSKHTQTSYSATLASLRTVILLV